MGFEDTELPLKQPDQKVGQSVKSEVYGYQDSNKVVKIEKGPMARNYETVEEALAQAKTREAAQKKLSEYATEHGARANTVPPQESLLHKALDDNQKVVIGQVQEYFKGAVTLDTLGGNLSSLSPQALQDLRAILNTNLQLWKTDKQMIDIVGSHGPFNRFLKLWYSVNPLTHSKNIILDENGNPKLIDPEVSYGKGVKIGLNNWISQQVQLFGTKHALAQVEKTLQQSAQSSAPEAQPLTA